MYRRILFWLAAAVAILAALFANRSPPPVPQPRTSPWPGRNNTVLFLSNSERGVANVMLATSQALLQRYPDVEVHYASFPALAGAVEGINQFGSGEVQSTGDVTDSEEARKAFRVKLHVLTSGPSLTATQNTRGFSTGGMMHAPGIRGLTGALRTIRQCITPWTGPDYLALYHEIRGVVETIDPIVVVVEPLFAPAIDAVRAMDRQQVILTPNAISDTIGAKQPWGAVFWKYPVISSGHPFPLPLHLIPTNIYLLIRLGYAIFSSPQISTQTSFLQAHGIPNPVNPFSIYSPNITWISASHPSADFALSTIPSNVFPVGPIYLSTPRPEVQDPDLAEWLTRKPTIYINLGTNFQYDELSAREMAKAIKTVFNSGADVQVLWKFSKRDGHDFDDSYLSDLQFERIFGTLRLEGWIDVDPASLLGSRQVVVSVHHGGANLYHEAVAMGVTQLVLPMWADCYEYGTRVEWLGVGLVGNKGSAPNLNGEELGEKLVRMVSGDQETVEMRERAKALAAAVREGGVEGKVKAAELVARRAMRA